MTATQEQLFAFALYEIRYLLAGHLGSQRESDLSVRAAAHLAYAMHNEAETVLHGGAFDPGSVVARLGVVDEMLGTDFQRRLAEATRDDA
ncbi:hypothetical protein ABQZ69_05245 [Xanthomonas sp. WHRI 8391]|uniref:Uncharacterized protein n=1 Tax=Xanthomonas hortorum pv. carotae TaxID=487904 RepID=A0A6V7BRB3_9XANT|nr:hypothetical protein [Xanthomonas hortorum]ETC90210.1 hypothetical protein XHC_0254 [Xanthomonas hortorum pv. carotae str. M081]MBG3849275.1 hypothetical protein [Xanthomonas hortorum pv. carotae]UTS74096.1 hypothetical protein NMB96_04440 [Xanthomonas hortorum]CAD0304809.1 hypothetical protein CFBP7900_03280 [Xanthomonas hortorum pv. carotae]CAD0304816.1 hypothetical protein CFBP7900_03280 [Xanthomonas hortorum pv. carotae]